MDEPQFTCPHPGCHVPLDFVNPHRPRVGNSSETSCDHSVVRVLDKEMECPICNLVLSTDNTVHPDCDCQHNFCRSCIEIALKNKAQCPLCNASCTINGLKKSRVICNLVSELTIACFFESTGCQWRGPMSTLKKHVVSECGLASLHCPASGCSFYGNRCALVDHMHMHFRDEGQPNELKRRNKELENTNVRLNNEIQRLRETAMQYKSRIQYLENQVVGKVPADERFIDVSELMGESSVLPSAPEGLDPTISSKEWNSVTMTIRNIVGQDIIKYPWGVCVDGTGRIIVSDLKGHKIHVFHSNGSHSHSFGGKDATKGRLCEPRGITIGKNSEIVVLDAGDCYHHCVYVIDYDSGNVLSRIGSSCSDKRLGSFNEPLGMAIDGENKLFVVEHENHRVQYFSCTNQGQAFKPENSFGCEGGNDGQFKYPWDICLSTQNNLMVVSDNENNRLQLFDLSGRFIQSQISYHDGDSDGRASNSSFGSSVSEGKKAYKSASFFDRMRDKKPKKLGSPTGVAFLPDGCIVCCDKDNKRVVVMDIVDSLL